MPCFRPNTFLFFQEHLGGVDMLSVPGGDSYSGFSTLDRIQTSGNFLPVLRSVQNMCIKDQGLAPLYHVHVGF